MSRPPTLTLLVNEGVVTVEDADAAVKFWARRSMVRDDHCMLTITTSWFAYERTTR